MDREFIEKNQIVERYLTGKLPPKGVTDFERVCRSDPRLVEELGLAGRVNAAIRLLEASGQPEPWQEKPRAFWEKPPFIAAAAALAVVFAISALLLFLQTRGDAAQISQLEADLVARPIDPASTGRTITVLPSRTGPVSAGMFTTGNNGAEFVEMRIDVSWADTPSFRVLIERRGEGRVLQLHNLLRDSNGNLRVSLNSSALGPGLYTIAIESLNWRGEPTPAAWAAFEVDAG
jgi:hypothetical protein